MAAALTGRYETSELASFEQQPVRFFMLDRR